MSILFLSDLIDLVYKDDTVLCPAHVIAGSREQLGDNTLNIIAYVAGFRQRCRIGQSERNIEQFCEGLYNVGLAASGRSDHKDIGFLYLDRLRHIRIRY